MKIMMAAAECAPFVKTGGLADVMGALPKALAELGHEVMVVLPKYTLISAEYEEKLKLKRELEVPFKGQKGIYNVFEYEMDGVQFIFVENGAYYGRDQIYSQADDAERFAFFSRAVLAVLEAESEAVDILHVHDWHTAVLPFLIKEDQRWAAIRPKIKTVLTIHNLQFQGCFPKQTAVEEFELDERYFDEGMVEWRGNFNMLKTGILYADQVTTVSPSYRDEILTEAYGENLQPLLQKREADLVGILNGVDTVSYNPAADRMIEMPYDQTSMEGKAVNKRAAQIRFKLPEQGDIPLMTMVSRLAGQKGIDILEETLPTILKTQDVQFILLGSGEEKYEHFFRQLAEAYPEKVAIHIGFDEELAHLLYAGADIFLMPSHFEPCGLSQLVSMIYGTVPVANKTGGLRDTVVEYDEAMRSGNGFLSDFSKQQSFGAALKRALRTYDQNEHWETIKQNGMNGNYSWNRSAEEYMKLYENLSSK